MRKGYYRIFVTALVMLISISIVLTGCGGNAGNPAQDTTAAGADTQAASETTAGQSGQEPDTSKLSWQQDTSPFTFDLYFFGAWGDGYPWRGALVEKYITEATGVTPNIIIPTGNEKEYLNVMIASNDLPDAMVLEWYAPETKKLIESGNIYSVNELSEKYAPELMGMIPDDVITYHKQSDGKLYYLPSFFTSKEEFEESIEKHGARPLFIQKGIYEALGKPAVATTDDLLQLLRDVKTKYPDVKPFAIEPPLDVSQWGLTGNLTLQYYLVPIFAPETYGRDQYLEGDKIKLVFESPNYVEAIRFLNKIYKEGLISVDTLMMKHENFGETVDSAQWGVTGRFAIDVWKNHNAKIMALTNDESKTYIPLPFPKFNGKEPQFAGGRGAGWVGSMVTKNAKDPGRIIRYFEYSWSDEGQITNLFGKEGETFDMVDGMPQYKPEILKEIASDPTALKEKYGFEQRLLMWRSKWGGWQKVAMAPQSYADYLRSVSQYGKDVWDLGLDSLDPDPTSSEGVAYAKIKNIWNKYLSKMILAETDADFNAAYEAGMKEIQDAGLEKVKSLMTENHLKDVAKKQGK